LETWQTFRSITGCDLQLASTVPTELDDGAGNKLKANEVAIADTARKTTWVPDKGK